MKANKYILIFFISLIGLISCDLDKVLEEIPKDFSSPENSFTDKSGFESALANIYLNIRSNLYTTYDSYANFDMLGIDIDFGAHQIDNDSYNQYFYWNTINADSEFAEKWWGRLYYWIYQANTVIDRSDDDYVTWESEAEKNAIVGEAKFIRAFAYHFLANMWGGVPLVLNETASATFNYTRATQEAVYLQCKEDLEFAVQWMPTVNELQGGRAPRAAAYHLLSEIDICLEDYDGAIAAANQIIGNNNYYLMTERFGVYKDFTFNGYDYQGENEPWGDVYWDLFREGNMNWLEGNHEAIWNIEMDVATLGGGNVGRYGGNFVLERWWGPCVWRINDVNGVLNFLKDTLCGRPLAGLNTMGITPTDYVTDQIWQFKDDWNRDIRNSKYNIQREFYWTNPASEFYGQLIKAEDTGIPSSLDVFTSPWFKKPVTAVHHAQFQDASSGEWHDNGRIYKDWYIMRLAETYLLRAEAYYRNGNSDKAADDINVVRNRAQATPVTSGEVDLDLILDERARELYMEEFRISTLMRMEKLPEYLMKYSPVVIQNGYQLDDHINKLPIPNSEIEANSEAVLEQNPGY